MFLIFLIQQYVKEGFMSIVKITKKVETTEAFACGCWQLGGESDC